MHPDEVRTKARAAVAEALRFGPDLAKTHCANAQFSLLFEWDWASAERSFLRALEINPGYGQASAWYHLFYTGLAAGMWKESEEALIAGYERDPRSAYLASIVGVLMAAYRTDDAIERWVARADELDPGAFLSIWVRQLAMCAMRDWPRAERASDDAHAASGRTSLPLVVHGLGLATAGNLDGARSIYDELRARSRREYIAPSAFALLEAALGDNDAAIAHCREAIALRDPQFVIFARGWPNSEALRALPEHRAMLVEIGLPGTDSQSPRGA